MGNAAAVATPVVGNAHQTADAKYLPSVSQGNQPDQRGNFGQGLFSSNTLQQADSGKATTPTSRDSSEGTGGGTPGRQPLSSSLYMEVPATKIRKPTTCITNSAQGWTA